MGFWNKKIKNVTELSKTTGIDAEKIQELKEGKREIEGETMEKILNAINESNKKTDLEKRIEKDEILRWFKEVDLKQLIKDFGYESQKECAKKIGVAQSCLWNYVTGNFNDYGRSTQKIYDFFHNDFNKKAKKEIKEVIVNTNIPNYKLNYLKSFNFVDLRNKLGYERGEDLANDIGISRSTMTNVWSNLLKTDTTAVDKIYSFVKDKLDNNIKKEKEDKKEYVENSALKYLSNLGRKKVVEIIGEKTLPELYKKVNISKCSFDNVFNGKSHKDTATVKRLYDYVIMKQNNDISLKLTETPQILTKEENNINILDNNENAKYEDKNDEIEDVLNNDEEDNKKFLKRKNKFLYKKLKQQLKLNDELSKKIIDKNNEIETLKNQIRRYEILIDRLK